MSAVYARDCSDLLVSYSCQACGKVCYANRRDARRAARRLYPGKHMRAYRCGTWFHLTSRLERAKVARAALRAAEA